MKQLLFALLFLPCVVSAQDEKTSKERPFEGWQISDCQKYAINQLAKGTEGELKAAAEGRIVEGTKTIYIAKQKWLQNVPDTSNGYNIVYIDIDSNGKMLAEEVKKNHAAVYYISPFEMRSNMCEMWVFPIEMKKKGKQEYSTTAYKMNFFFNYDPPKYEYRGTDAVVLE
ncbi:MAG: hypothetical protein KDC07_04065 [Chitinophagaceae bacterium]|nr:hypothetical protein [Chitinophagaceae bacterium]